MKSTITITGQINGNYALRNAIGGAKEIKTGMFNAQIMTFNTKKEARKALWEAYKGLRQDDGTGLGGVRYCKRSALYFDASQAIIN